ncbi:MAG: T9SS type A sorting domain-containing protein [Bacteroidales bacterium]|nr:T9SS type A sorting domain-containing protein [Bacteroidales bacterium]
MKHMLCVMIIIIISAAFLNAQEVVATAGNHGSSSSGSISWTIGESVTETLTGTNSILTQGFHQTSLTITIIRDLPGLDYLIEVFPNPVWLNAKLRIDKQEFKRMEYMLYDMNGNLLIRKTIKTGETEIPFSLYVPSSYILKITEKNVEIKSFKIIKSY